MRPSEAFKVHSHDDTHALQGLAAAVIERPEDGNLAVIQTKGAEASGGLKAGLYVVTDRLHQNVPDVHVPIWLLLAPTANVVVDFLRAAVELSE